MVEKPRFLVGTAGWSIASRHTDNFPEMGTHLERYGRSLDATEINSSFYRPHSRQTYERWANSVPDGFRFSVKLPKSITHDRRLIDCADQVEKFVGEVDGLAAKLAVVLVQLPPNLPFAEATALAFLDDLHSRSKAWIALEPRHASWFSEQVDEELRKRQIARVAADPARVPGAESPAGWDGLAYFRLHGTPVIYRSDYADRLDGISRQISQTPAREVWCIFDNTVRGYALGNALSLQEKLR